MSSQRREGSDHGAVSPAEGGGTPFPVDFSRDVEARLTWAAFVGAPVIWFAHFMLVYLVGEAGCTGDGPGLSVLDPPVPVALTLVTTVLAVGACAAMGLWSFRRWQERRRTVHSDDQSFREFDDDRHRAGLAFAGFLLSVFSAVAVLFTGAPALVLGPC